MNIIRESIGIIFILAFWLLLSNSVSDLFLASPADTIYTIILLFKSGNVFPVLFVSLSRVLFAIFFGSVLGILCGLVLGSYPSLYSFVEIPIDFFRSIPNAALYPLFLIVFGIGNPAKLATASWAVFLLMLVSTSYGVKTVKNLKIDVCKVFGASKLQTFWWVKWRESMPHILAGLRVSVSIALVVVVMTEMFFGTTIGLGREIYNASLIFAMPELYAWILITGFVGYILNKLIAKTEKRLIHWVAN